MVQKNKNENKEIIKAMSAKENQMDQTIFDQMSPLWREFYLKIEEKLSKSSS